MKYNNPIIKGFYPDPSVCKVEDTYYLVCSSFQYFPGVPIFESKDLINWKQIGHCLTRKSQINLKNINSSGGVFAPTIRYNNGQFYMTTTNNTTNENFYVWTDDIYSEWSDPIYVDQGGIDPSLYFEDEKTYFISNGKDDYGINGIVQCEIDIRTGKKLTSSRTIWTGSGGRFLEGPHMYKINGRYYLIVAEGGTEFGHMVTCARGDSPYGKFEGNKDNPVLTNRNLGGYEIQGVGHGDLIQDDDGKWWLIHLGFRQSGQWEAYHHLGREVFLTPINFRENGWFIAGHNGTTTKYFSINNITRDIIQNEKKTYTFENTDWDKDWCYLRIPNSENYKFTRNKLRLRGTDITLDKKDSPTFIGLRQKDFNANISCDISIFEGEAGITLYMDENHHYDLAIRKKENGYEVIKRLNIGDIKSIEKTICLENNNISLVINASNKYYSFYIRSEDEEVYLGKAQTKYLSSEVAGGFTGVIIGLYAYGSSCCDYTEFINFKCEYI
ncbi:glycoside hydrolase family 43 protein [Clostridium nigeriense]|uniref:glycoside hydrolase family 43 protein n=1 Tax=Clostridium nigeriense TaxID=1805470 RepID=UPI003D3505A1